MASESKKPETSIPTAADLVAFEHGAAGHEGISTDSSGSLLIKPCTQAEVDFYESAKNHPHFQAHMPTFMGSLSLNKDPAVEKHIKDTAGANEASAAVPSSQDAPSKEWAPSGGAKLTTSLAIVLSNAASGFERPNVLDVKLGARLWDDDAPLPKRKKLDEVSDETTSGSLGFRVAGMKVWLGEDENQETVEVNTKIEGGWKIFDKFYGRSFDKDNVKNAFTKYLGGVDESSGKLKAKNGRKVAERLLREIESIEYVLENEESRMYSASILMVYEGDSAVLEEKLKEDASREKKPTREEGDDEDDDEDEVEVKVQDVCLIDFAHAHWTPGQGPDENALRGVRSVVRILKEILVASS